MQRRALGELRALGGTVDLDVRFTGGGYTALERATTGKPDVDLIDALLEAGASLNARGLCSPLERLVVSNGREPRIGPHTVAGVLSLDVTPKPDTRRPVYFARTAWWRRRPARSAAGITHLHARHHQELSVPPARPHRPRSGWSPRPTGIFANAYAWPKAGPGHRLACVRQRAARAPH